MSPKNGMPAPEKPPRGLETAGKRLWNSMMVMYEFNTAERVILLEMCRCHDTLENLAVLLRTRMDPEKLKEQRQQQLTFARLHAALRLPDVQDGLTRPQHRTGFRGPYKPNLKVVS